MKHTLRQLIIHLRKVAEIIRKEWDLLWKVAPWDDDDTPMGGSPA